MVYRCLICGLSLGDTCLYIALGFLINGLSLTTDWQKAWCLSLKVVSSVSFPETPGFSQSNPGPVLQHLAHGFHRLLLRGLTLRRSTVSACPGVKSISLSALPGQHHPGTKVTSLYSHSILSLHAPISKPWAGVLGARGTHHPGNSPGSDTSALVLSLGDWSMEGWTLAFHSSLGLVNIRIWG